MALSQWGFFSGITSSASSGRPLSKSSPTTFTPSAMNKPSSRRTLASASLAHFFS